MLHKTLFRSAAFAVMTLASTLAHAHDGSDGWVTLNQPYYLWSNTYEDNIIRIMLRVPDYYHPYINTTSCPNSITADSYMVSTAIPADARQRIFTTLLSAKLAGKPVRLFIDGCQGGLPRVQMVAVE
jgi:hypothetical protein